MPNRRKVLAGGFAAGGVMLLGGASAARAEDAAKTGVASAGAGRRFKLNYAPHLGMFKHHAGDDPVAQIKFMADQGFTAFEDNGLAGRPRETQEAIGVELKRQGMTMGVFVAEGNFKEVTFGRNDAETRAALQEKMRAAVALAPVVGARWCTVVPGCYDQQAEWGYQTANVIDNLKACAEILEPSGLIMVLEPLNPRDHPGLFLTEISQGYQICRAVGSASCKILDDLYHQQVTEGDLIPNLDRAWEEIAYFQTGDNPGRKEPGTGEINYRNIFKHLKEKGFQGVIGMEHGNMKEGKEGELAVIEAYRRCDEF